MVLENAVTGTEEEDEEFVDELKSGTKLLHKQYVIEDFLNSGGFGITYLARDSLNRQVVIKECFPSSFCHRKNMSIQPRSRAHQAQLRGIVRLFAREAISLAKVEHPNIVGVHNVFEDNNTAYMAMDYIKGRDLLEIIDDKDTELAPNQIVEYLEKLLSAIGYVHDSGLLHRDISPDNILINEDGEPILIDFGAARDQAGEVTKRCRRCGLSKTDTRRRNSILPEANRDRLAIYILWQQVSITSLQVNCPQIAKRVLLQSQQTKLIPMCHLGSVRKNSHPLLPLHWIRP